MDKKTFLYTKYTFKKFKHKKHKNTNTTQSPGMYVFMTNLGVIITQKVKNLMKKKKIDINLNRKSDINIL